MFLFFFVDEGIDSGPIIVQKELEIQDKSQEELIWELKFLGANAIIEACNLINRYNGKPPTSSNDDELKTYFSKPTVMDVKEFKQAGKRFF